MTDQEELQQEIMQFQQLKEQVQIIATQVGQMDFQVKETDHTIEELNGVMDEATVFKSAAGILIKVDDHAELKSELEERKETLAIRLKSMKHQEDQLKQRLQKMEADITQKIQLFQAQQGMGGAGMPT